jgi:hypothetical protein
MKARTRQLDALPETSEEHENRPYVPNILEEDEIKQIYLDRGAEDHLDESQDEGAEEDELEEEDAVGLAAQGNRS